MHEGRLVRSEWLSEGSKPTLSRRQIIRAGAWAAPVLVLATAAPAAAVSIPTTQGVITATIVRFYLKTPINNGQAEFEYQVRLASQTQNDNTGGDVLNFHITGFDTGQFTGTISGGSITWSPPSNGTATGTRAAASRGQVTQGTFVLAVKPNTNPQAISGKVTMTVWSTNANGQGSNSVSATAGLA